MDTRDLLRHPTFVSGLSMCLDGRCVSWKGLTESDSDVANLFGVLLARLDSWTQIGIAREVSVPALQMQ